MTVRVAESIAQGKLKTVNNFDRWRGRILSFLIPFGLSIFLAIELVIVYPDHDLQSDLIVLFLLCACVIITIWIVRNFSRDPSLVIIPTTRGREEDIKICLKIAKKLYWQLTDQSQDHLVFLNVTSRKLSTRTIFIHIAILFDHRRLLIAATIDFTSSDDKTISDFIQCFNDDRS